MRKLKDLAQLKAFQKKAQAKFNSYWKRVRICLTGCRAYGAEDVRDSFLKELKKKKVQNEIEVVETGCHGFCARAPVLVIDPGEIFYQRVTVEDVPSIVEKTLLKDELIDNLLYHNPETGEKIIRASDIPFYRKQTRIVLRNLGQIDPKNISHYLARDGYSAFVKVLTELSPEQVIEEIKQSGLRGRGGAGFPTGLKWELTRKAKGSKKYIICNADEGDPGAFMDRAVLEGDPHSIVEGLLIAGYAIGADEGYIYVRAEYPIAVQHVKIAVKQAEEHGLLGQNILGTGFNFKINIKEGAGAFVCGEETALIASIEGKRGMPRPRPPFPAQSGLWAKPTSINNVETLANIAWIILNGAKKFSSIGTEKSKGTKIFSLAGKVNNTGLVEVPFGITLREIIFDIGGGVLREKKFKAAQMGGPSGGCIPARYLDLPLDYESLVEIGSMVGSGGLIVMDEATCMVEIARFFMDFVQDESCGKCTPCRIGTKRMLEILTRATQGRAEEKDLSLLLELASGVKDTSLCGLGKTAPNPVLSTMQYFEDEYKAHVIDKRCPAFACEALYISPCSDTCPARTEVHGYVALIAEGMFKEALELIKETNPFPAICGRVCHHPCEARCRRGDIDQPVALRALKRFVADRELEWRTSPPSAVKRTKKEKVAIIGSGPAGLAAAHQLVRMGYGVTVFESLPVAGGMLVAGIPNYRLPTEIVQLEIEDIEALGVEIKTNTTIGKDISFDDLFKQGYKAILVAVGATTFKKMNIPGEDLDGVYFGLDFLRRVNFGERVDLGKSVIVIGGGNVAVDSARTARRLGCQVNLLYRRGREEMLAAREEIEYALQEKVGMDFLVVVTEIIGQNGKVVGAKCLRTKLGPMDITGRRQPIPIEGSEFTLKADSVIVAVGQGSDLSFLPSKVGISKRGTIVVDPETFATNYPGVFAAGDVVTGPATVIEAIAAGNKVAIAIDKYLGGTGKIVKERVVKPILVKSEKLVSEKERHVIPTISVEKRIANFKEVELPYSEEMAIEEAKRCLKCHLKE